MLVLSLTADGYGWRFIRTAELGGTFSDAGTAQCHGAPPNATTPPTANAGGPYTSSDGTVHFAGSATVTADNQQPLTYVWDFGDGNSNFAQNPTHTYAGAGTYTASLIAIDAHGARSDPSTARVTVLGINPTVTLSGAANIGNCRNDNDGATGRILDSLPGYVFTAGDNAFENGYLTEYLNCYHPAWGRQRSRTFPVLGNIEYSSGTADGAFDYFGTRAGTRGQGWYSVDLGAWHLIVLNDNVDFSKGSAQEQWLEADLAANTRRCTMAMWHVPLFLSSSTAGYTVNPGHQVLWDDLYAAGVDVVVNGNQHQYERMAPMRPDGTRDDQAGIVQFNVGTGGESVGLPTTIHPNSVALFAAYGVIKFTLRQGGLDWTFLPVPGATATDSGTLTCH